MGCLGRCVTPYSDLAAFTVIIQTIFVKHVKHECMACSTGKFLALLMIYGLTYLMVTHASPIHSIKNGISGEESILKGRIGFKRLLRKPPRLPPRLSPYEKAFLQAWSGYKMYAMGSDKLMPLSKRGIDGLGDFGATVVDALDTKMIMKLNDVVKESGSWIEKNLPGSSSKKGQVNLF
ncbi:mannosyl-oligosaccharide 1,2-alpha-mannosidase MNS3 [Tanacetum coccineum]